MRSWIRPTLFVTVVVVIVYVGTTRGQVVIGTRLVVPDLVESGSRVEPWLGRSARAANRRDLA
jgi:hypothetical protein